MVMLRVRVAAAQFRHSQGYLQWISRSVSSGPENPLVCPQAFSEEARLMLTRPEESREEPLFGYRRPGYQTLPSSNTFLIVSAISFFARGFMRKALMPACFEDSAFTR